MNKATYRLLRILGTIILTLGTFHNVYASGLPLPESPAVQSPPTTYYVSKNGNNRDGLSWDTAWNELDQINWSSIQAGDTIYIDGGTYHSSLSVGTSGTPSSPITITGIDNVVIDGQNQRSRGISIRNKSYIEISNIKVTNQTNDDVYIDASSNVLLEGLEVYVTGRALFIQESNNITVRGCDIRTPTNLSRQTDGIYSQRNKNNIYENNHIVIYNQNASGHDDAIQLYQDDSAIIRGNYLAQVNSKVANAQGLYATTMYGTSKFYNNVVNLGNAQSNALSFRRLPTLGGTGTVEIVENTIYGIRPYHGIWVTEVDAPVVKNNIVYVLSGAALTLSGSSSGVSNNYIGNPKFVGTDDFHLQSVSPAINAGANLGSFYNVDKDGVARPQGSGYDIGAYEYSSDAQISTSIPNPSPTPTGTSILPTSTNVPPTVTITPPATETVVPLIATETPIPASPTPTEMSLLPTETASPVAPSPTVADEPSTETPLPATLTPIATVVLFPTATPTDLQKPPSPTPAEEVTSESGTETIYDDRDNAFKYSAGWKNVKNKKAYNGSFKETAKNGASVTLNFTGRSFSVLYRGGKAFRKIDVYVDGELVGTINQRQKTGFQLRWNYPGQLAPGKHTLKLVFVDNKTTHDRTNGSLDAVIVH